MNEDIPQQNTGVLLGSVTKALWIAGQIPYEIVLQSGDWRPYLPIGEKQRPYSTDMMACVTFSAESDIEIQSKQQNGIEPNWSDRFIAKLSGTTPQGNYLDKVADTLRLFGVVKEEEWPFPPNATWNSYYSEIPQEVKDKAIKLDIAYESISGDKASLLYHLKQAPIQIIVTKTVPTHAVCLVHIEGDTAYYFDSYSPYLKTINVANIYGYALKIVLKASMNQTKIVLGKDGKTVYKAIPVATDFENFKKQASVEGIEVPTPIPPASSL